MPNNILNGKSFLLTQSSLHWLAGSEMYILELAEYLRSNNAKVKIFTYYFDYPIKSVFDDKNIEVTTDENILDLSSFDYVWVNHQTLPVSIIKNLKNNGQKPIFIFNHMSPFEHLPIEKPFIWEIEDKIASVSVYNSKETFDSQKKLLNNNQPKIILPNPAPEEFSKIERIASKTVRKILIVSNHAPSELEEAAKKLVLKGIQVEHAFSSSEKPRHIDAAYISKFDVVVSIGKTVQYCLTAGIPIYVYDYFGGPGYLNKKNFKSAEKKNFSGRGFEKKSSKKIAKEIIEEYLSATEYYQNERKLFIEKFALNKVFPRLLNDIKPKKMTNFTDKYINYLITSYRKNSEDLLLIRNQSKKIDQYAKEINDVVLQNKLLNSEISDVYTSLSWRLTQPLRKIKVLVSRLISE